ncbi:hypothetical protein MKS88_004036 [Plasmodium brasilianum]|uniref:Uncharacterized protein n=1 Tax=Plasmodium brasilianum TaxID=5824 RepID=A0ACB9Y4K3_PLABR|nr:hypothetical protein MKS88_004036 [Plasmodium brasilianum]
MSYHGYGYSSFQYLLNGKFRNIRNHILSVTSILEKEKRKSVFREKCLELADYIISENKAPPNFEQNKWNQALKNLSEYKYRALSRHGGCPMILEQNDRDLLVLKYDAEDFYKKKQWELKRIEQFQKEENIYDCNENRFCMKKYKEYNVWIKEREKYFQNKKSIIDRNSSNEQTKITFTTPISKLLSSETFSELSEISISSSPPADEKIENLNPKESETLQKKISISSPSTHEAGTEASPKKISSDSSEDTQSEHQSKTNGSESSEVSQSTVVLNDPSTSETTAIVTIPGTKETIDDPEISANQNHPSDTIADASQNSQISSTSFSSSSHSLPTHVLPIHPKSSGMFKKKKKIKRTEVKFLRILVPSYYNRSKFLRHNLLEHPINEDEEIIKKIKIQEHNMNKNENVSYGKKDRSITIIEVHMEILEECRNKEWEYNKGEFLAICQEVLTKKENRTNTNLKDDEVVMDNTKSTNEIEKQKSLWSKWVERHKIFLEKLRKKDWFNNLKNDWKEERSYIKNREKLRKYLSNENEKDPFLERKKDIWRHWVSRKGTIVEKYLEEELFEKLTEEIYNMLDTYENEGRKDDILFMNKEELENKENYEVLYKYFKTKLLEKLCILVFMMVLEECKNEEYIENMESHFDNSINECITGKNLDIKPEIEENLTDINGDVLGNIKNNKNYTYEGEDCFREELKEWIRENDAYINSLDSDNNIDECYQVVE